MNAAAKSIWMEAAQEVAGQVGQAVRHEVCSKREAPEVWARFHAKMAKRLPRWRWAARAWHRMMARRMEAMVSSGF